MRVRLNGKPWQVIFRAPRNLKLNGICDPHKRVINIRRDLEPAKLMEVLLHECLHAQRWELDEETIEDMSEELAAILIKLGVVLEYPPTRRKRR